MSTTVTVFLLLLFLWGIYYGTSRLLRLLFNRNSPGRIASHFQRMSDNRVSQALALSQNRSDPPGDFSTWEIITTFCFLLSRGSVSDSIRVAEMYGDQGWASKYDHDLFDKLERTALSFSAKRWKKDAQNVLQFGYLLAEKYPVEDWPDRYKRRIQQEYVRNHEEEWDRTREDSFIGY